MKRANYKFPTSRLPSTDLEWEALDCFRAGVSWGTFWRLHWRDVARAAGGCGWQNKMSRLAVLVEKLLAIVETGKIPENATAPATAPAETTET